MARDSGLTQNPAWWAKKHFRFNHPVESAAPEVSKEGTDGCLVRHPKN
jgi:hypothetical protein